MDIYILLVRRHPSDINEAVYVDSVFSYEEKAWKRIEEKLNTYIDTVKESGYKIKSLTISRNIVTFTYSLFIDHFYGQVIYEIVRRRVT